MTLNKIEKVVKDIDDIRDDPESAHSAEDQLHVDFIEHIAVYGPKSLKKMAKEVLKTKEISFPRWCA